MPNPTALSLCTGYGGLDLATAHTLGAHTIAVADNDPAAAALLAHRFPTAPNLGDITTAPWNQWAGVDLITAGYPCQPFSTAGRKQGTNDERHLFPHIARAIREVRPRLVLLENVAGHLALGFAAVHRDLVLSGYDTQWVCLPASGVGAPHRRNRVFLIAHHPERRRGNQTLKHHERRPPPNHRTAIPHQPNSHPHRGRPLPVANPDNLRGHGPGHPGGGRPQPQDSAHQWGPYAPAIQRWATTMGRPAPAPTVGGQLNPRLVEWMMGLPDGWVTDIPALTRAQQLRLLGNGVVPQQATAALEHMGLGA